MTPEDAKAYLAAVDDLSAHLGYDEAEVAKASACMAVSFSTGTAMGHRNSACCSKRVRGTLAVGTGLRSMTGIHRRFISI